MVASGTSQLVQGHESLSINLFRADSMSAGVKLARQNIANDHQRDKQVMQYSGHPACFTKQVLQDNGCMLRSCSANEGSWL